MIMMIKNRIVHYKTIRIAYKLRTICDPMVADKSQRTHLFNLYYGMMRIYISAHKTNPKLVSFEEIRVFIDINYARLWDINLWAKLSSKELMDLVVFLTVTHRICCITSVIT